MTERSGMARLREAYHREVVERVLRIDAAGVPNNADRGSESSKRIAVRTLAEIGAEPVVGRQSGQAAGRVFESVTKEYLESAFSDLGHLRPGEWEFSVGQNLRDFAQFRHLTKIRELVERNRELRTILGDYIVKPDIVVARQPMSDDDINAEGVLIGTGAIARRTPLRLVNSSVPIMHASVSCKWTIRSDRSQNARTEALNLIRNRKGNTPHIVVVTAEPLPGRLASIAMGTGDVDCVYHWALPEMASAVDAVGADSDRELLAAMVDGSRLRDVSDLPFDLAM